MYISFILHSVDDAYLSNFPATKKTAFKLFKSGFNISVNIVNTTSMIAARHYAMIV
jgi:hypothetical protein